MEASDKDNITNHDILVQAKPYLPSWVLRMREKIDLSRAAHADAEMRISSLQSDVATLSIKLEKMMPQKTSLELSSTGRDNNVIGFSSSSAAVLKAQHSKCDSNLRFVDLPLDLLIIVSEYLLFLELFVVRSSCHHLKRQIESSLPWRLLRTNCPFHFLCKQTIHPGFNIAVLNLIIDYSCKASQGKRFLCMMKEQRSIPKFRQVQPRRFSRSERNITHPLPIFDQGETMNNNQMVMSHAESLDGDFRTFAHRALEAMVLLSSCLYDRFANDVIDLGVVTVMISLLSNEESMIKSYASQVLANLLCWEAVTRRKCGAGVVDGKTLTMPLQDQILACNGQRQLPTLLTSPSATINLVASQPSTAEPSFLSNNRNSAKLSSRVQGVCNKHASRALVVLFYPDYPVHSRKMTIEDAMKTYSSSIKLPSLPKLASQTRQSNSLRLDKNFDKEEDHTSPTVGLPQRLQWSQQWLCDLVSSVMQEQISRPWQFTYFYKSGAFKDQFVTHLCFDQVGGIEGGGIDHIGSFCIDGESQVDMAGRTIFFQKTYLNGLQYSPEMTLLDYGPFKKGSAHVSHVAYWSDGILPDTSPSPELEPWYALTCALLYFRLNNFFVLF